MSWWDKSFSDVGWQGRKRKEEAAGSVEEGDTVAAVQRLFALDEAQEHEIRLLRLTVRVLTEILVDTMGLDEELLQHRMREAVDEAQLGLDPKALEKRVSETDITPISGDEAEAAPNRARCSICSAPAIVASTHFAEFGLVCDACHALGKPLPKH